MANTVFYRSLNQIEVTVNPGGGTIASGATSIALTTGHGSRIPSLLLPIKLTYSDPSDDSLYEIIHVTGVSTDTLTVTRGAEGTTPMAIPASGILQQRNPAGEINQFADALEDGFESDGDFLFGTLTLDTDFTLGTNIINDTFNAAHGIHVQNQASGYGTRFRLIPKTGFTDTTAANLEGFGTDFENDSTNYWKWALATRIDATNYPGLNGTKVVMLDAKGAGTHAQTPPDLLLSFNHSVEFAGSRECMRLFYNYNSGTPYTGVIFSSGLTSTTPTWNGDSTMVAQFKRNILISNTYGIVFRGADNANDWGLRLTASDVLTFKLNNSDLITFASTGAITAASDADVTHTLGRARIGAPTSDEMHFAHFDHMNTTNYALKQTAVGYTYLNAPYGLAIALRINNSSVFSVSASDAIVIHGSLSVGASGSTRGLVTAFHGSGGNTPGSVRLYSPNGTAWYVFVEDDGTLKIHNSSPAANTDGSVVGAQT